MRNSKYINSKFFKSMALSVLLLQIYNSESFASTTECNIDASLTPSRIYTSTYGSGGGTRSGPVSPSSVFLQTGRIVDGIYFDDKIYGRRAGAGRPGFVLSESEYINNLTIRAGAAIDRIEFYTSEGRSSVGGGGGGRRYDLKDVNAYKFTINHSDRVNGITIEYVKPFYPSEKIGAGNAILGYVPPNTTIELLSSDTLKILDSLKTTTTSQRSSSGKASIGVEIDKIFKLGFEASVNRSVTTAEEALRQYDQTIARSEKTTRTTGDRHGFIVTSVDIRCNPAEGGYLVSRGEPSFLLLDDDDLSGLVGYWTFVGGGAVEFVSGLQSEVIHGISMLKNTE